MEDDEEANVIDRVLEKTLMDEMEGVTPPRDAFLDRLRENLTAEGVDEWQERRLSPSDFTDGWITRKKLPLLEGDEVLETASDKLLKTPSAPQNTPSNSNDHISFVTAPAKSKIKNKGFMNVPAELKKENK